MLVRCRVEDHLRTVIVEDIFHSRQVTYIGDHRLKGQGRKVLLQLHCGLEYAVLAVPEQDKHLGSPAGDLTAYFASDRAPRTGDQHPFSGKGRTHQFILDLGRFAAQKVGDIHFTQAVYAYLAADQFEQPWHRAEGHSLEAADIRHHADDPSACAGDGNNHFIHRVAVQCPGQVAQFADHRYAVDLVLLFAGIVVEVANGTQAELRVALHLTHYQCAGVSRTDDQHLAGFSASSLGTGTA